MKHFFLIIVSFIFCLLLINNILAQAQSSKERIIVIDAGHGGKDSGAIGKRSKEKDIVLAIALKVGAYIEQNIENVKVIYTRDKDVFLELHERAQIANKNDAALFVSIHANSVKAASSPSGTETFVMGLHKTNDNLAVAQLENSSITLEDNYQTSYQGFDPNSSESYIMFSLMQNIYLDQSLVLAKLVQDEFRDNAKRHDRGVKQAGFLVLWKATMPSILIETGFISHAKEEEYLISDKGQENLSLAISKAIRKYIQYIDKTNNHSIIQNQEKSYYQVNNSETKEKIKEESVPVDSTKTTLIDQPECRFMVQVAITSKKLDDGHDLKKSFSNINEIEFNGGYKYALGSFISIEQAQDYKNSISEKFPDAFVIAFNGKKQITLKEAIELIQQKNK